VPPPVLPAPIEPPAPVESDPAEPLIPPLVPLAPLVPELPLAPTLPVPPTPDPLMLVPAEPLLVPERLEFLPLMPLLLPLSYPEFLSVFSHPSNTTLVPAAMIPTSAAFTIRPVLIIRYAFL